LAELKARSKEKAEWRKKAECKAHKVILHSLISAIMKLQLNIISISKPGIFIKMDEMLDFGMPLPG
jgi:hypothetical protein